MAKSFWASCSVYRDYNQGTAKYLEEYWGVKLLVQTDEDSEARKLVENYLNITVRDYPEIMTLVEEVGYLDEPKRNWQINRISEEGIALYLVNSSGKSEDGKRNLYEEAFIFIPMNNIIAIHNVSEQFFINETMRAMERKENKNNA